MEKPRVSKVVGPLAVILSLAGLGGAVELVLPRVGEGPHRVTVRATAKEGREREGTFTAPGSGTLELEAGMVWRFEGEGPGVLVLPRTELVTDPSASISLELLAAAEVRGRVVAPEGHRPRRVTLSVTPWPPSSPGWAPTFERTCQVGEDGGFACQLPVGRWDLRIHPEGLLSEIRWDVRVPEGGLDLGRVTAVAGTGLIAPVVDEDGAPVRGAAVELRPPADGAEPVATGKSNAHGVAVLRSLQPGRWLVRARAAGHAPSEPVPVALSPGAELRLTRPLVLRAGTPLRVVVDPPADPFERPWRVSLQGAEGPGSGPHPLAPSVTTDPEGWATWDNVPAGPVRLKLWDSAGGFWGSQEVDLATEPQPVVFQLHLLQLQGKVVEPEGAAGALTWKKGEKGSHRTIRVGLAAEGRFGVALPEDGDWTVTWTDLEGRESFPITVQVSKNGGSDLELRFPSGRVEGRVVDSKGRPVTGAFVRAYAAGEGGGSEPPGTIGGLCVTDARGAFRLSLPPGRVTVMVWKGAASASKEVEVSRDRTARVELQLPEPGTVSGTVVFRGMPAAGAAVTELPMTPGAFPLVQDTVAADGSFSLDIGSMPRALLLALSAGGVAFQVVTPGQEGVVLSIPESPAALEVSWPPAQAAPPSLELPGGTVALGVLAMMLRPVGAAAAPGHLLIPGLPPGLYRICPPPGAGEPCRDVQLFPGTTEQVTFGKGSGNGP